MPYRGGPVAFGRKKTYGLYGGVLNAMFSIIFLLCGYYSFFLSL
jgi:hypothetical protein